MSENLLQAAHAAAKTAKKHGADEASVTIARSRGVEVEWRDGQLDKVQESTRRSLSVAIYVDERYSASSTNDLRPDALDAFIAEAVAMTRLLEPDEHRRLPDPSSYEGRAQVDLELTDAGQADMTSAERLRTAQDLEQRVRQRAADLPVVSITTGVSDGRSETARVHTNGFEGAREGTHFAASAMMTVKDVDGRRPMGWHYTHRRHLADLRPLDEVAQVAVDKAAAQLGAGKLDTGKYRILVENRALGRLLGAFLGPLSGPALQQRRSLWEGKKGEQIASKLLTLYDDPLVIRGMGSALWDSDGFAVKRRPLIIEGVLQTYLIDQYYARKMGVEPTGGSTHNLEWTYGDRDLAGLVADVGEGVFIDRFLGGNSNGTTGEVSFGCAGRVIRNGELAEPVSEVNLAGHFGHIWERLTAVGNDPYPDSASRAPSCVFDAVQLSGQ